MSFIKDLMLSCKDERLNSKETISFFNDLMSFCEEMTDNNYIF